MLDLLARRGPDDEGVETFRGAILGHRRLAIFDLSPSGHQPMVSEDARVGIVFNGAIYNFRSLRRDLVSRGYTFQSETDTEVLLQGYRAWGIDGLLSRIDGMFAFGIWDERLDRLFLVRDRLGVKPLSYIVSGGRIAFGSTIGALIPFAAGSIDETALVEFLEFGFVTDERSIYSGIEKVRPGELVEWHGGNLSRRNYWELPCDIEDGVISFDEAVEETERLFLAAVEKRLHADVPVGALLSGGIDSSLVCWAVKKLGGDLTAYTVAIPNDIDDESGIAMNTADTLGLPCKVLEISAGVPPNIAELTGAFSEPFACTSAIGMLKISEAARRSVTVLLTGDGGDDVFLGYPEHRHFKLSEDVAKKLPVASTNLWRIARRAVPPVGFLKRARSFVDYSVGGLGAVGTARDGLPFYVNNDILGDRLEGVHIRHRGMSWSVGSGQNLLTDFLEYDRQTRFTGEYLTKVDGATMHHAVEARSPFLDSRLWEFASALPYSVRLNGGNSKALLREIARRRVGNSLAAGKKKGFTIPVQRWITNEWRKEVTEVLENSVLATDGWINSTKALNVLDRCPDRSSAPRQLWFLYVLESWFRHQKAWLPV